MDPGLVSRFGRLNLENHGQSEIRVENSGHNFRVCFEGINLIDKLRKLAQSIDLVAKNVGVCLDVIGGAGWRDLQGGGQDFPLNFCLQKVHPPGDPAAPRPPPSIPMTLSVQYQPRGFFPPKSTIRKL
jgi:hypothetical protein